MMRRGFQIIVLLVLLLLVPLSVTGIWVRQVIVDKSTFVSALDEVPADPDVQDAIVAIVGNAASSRLTVDWPTFVTSTVSSPTIQRQLLSLDPDVRGFVEDQTRAVLEDPAFRPTWTSIIEAVHPMLLNLVRGSDSVGASDDIELNISPVYNALVAHLATQGIDVTRVLPAEIDDLTLTVYEPSSLHTIQRYGRLIDRWAIPLAVVAVILGALVVVTSRRKMLAGAVLGLTVLISMAASLFGLTVVLGRVLNRSLDPAQRDAALAIVRELTGLLRDWMLWVGIAGAVVMVACLVAQFLLRRSSAEAVYR